MTIHTAQKDDASNTVSISNHKFFLILLSLCASCLFLPLPAGLSEEGRRALLLVVFAVAMWVKEIVPPPLTALLLMVLFPLFNILTYQQSISGLGNSSTWLLLGVFIISAAIQETGLEKRLALHLLRIARGNSSLNLLMVIVTSTLFIFILPTNSGRAALLVPICLGMLNEMQLQPGSNIAKSTLLAVSFTSFVGSIGLMTGAVSMVYVVGLFESLVGFTWNYIAWIKALLPSVVIINISIWIIFLKIFPPEINVIPGGLEYINKEIRKMDKMNRQEIKMLLLLVLMILLWILEDYVQISVSQTCLMIAILTMLPGVDILTWKKATNAIDWSILLLLGASLAMVEALTSTQAINWFAETIFIHFQGLSPTIIGILTMLIIGFIRLGFPNLLSMIATTFPIVISMALFLEINPIWLGLIGISSSILGVFLPTQALSHLTTYNLGFYSMKDMFRAGTYTALIIIITTTLLANIYWPLLGISP
ncbi:MAG: SLC13 family permease [Peptococcaceae bacterium]